MHASTEAIKLTAENEDDATIHRHTIGKYEKIYAYHLGPFQLGIKESFWSVVGVMERIFWLILLGYLLYKNRSLAGNLFHLKQYRIENLNLINQLNQTIFWERKERNRGVHMVDEDSTDRKLIITVSIREEPRKCDESNFRRIREYADHVGADFIIINRTDHPALRKTRDEQISENYYRFSKFFVLNYFAQRDYDAIAWFDDSILINHNCPCTPNIFTFSKTSIVAVSDILGPMAMETICNHFDFECSTYRMFNSGLMVFQKKHFQLFHSFEKLRIKDGMQCWKQDEIGQVLCDEPYFNYLQQKLNFKWVDLNEYAQLVDQGSEMRKKKRETQEPFACIGHCTRGAGDVREEILCNPWDFCENPDDI